MFELRTDGIDHTRRQPKKDKVVHTASTPGLGVGQQCLACDTLIGELV
jgi:hypothetical protein